MRAPRRRRGRPAQSQHPTDVPLPGYLCELCQDAPAVQWQLAPEGGEMGVCEDCSESERDTDTPKKQPEPYEG
jgi:hypothetical protein